MADVVSIQAVVEAISRLSPADRRNLVRRLRVSGLLGSAELATDRRRLSVAPALGMTPPPHTLPAAQAHMPQLPPAELQPPSAPAVRLRMAPPVSGNASAVSGHVVIGSPQHDESVKLDPHDMAPLPGRAPERIAAPTASICCTGPATGHSRCRYVSPGDPHPSRHTTKCWRWRCKRSCAACVMARLTQPPHAWRSISPQIG